MLLPMNWLYNRLRSPTKTSILRYAKINTTKKQMRETVWKWNWNHENAPSCCFSSVISSFSITCDFSFINNDNSEKFTLFAQNDYKFTALRNSTNSTEKNPNSIRISLDNGSVSFDSTATSTTDLHPSHQVPRQTTEPLINFLLFHAFY